MRSDSDRRRVGREKIQLLTKKPNVPTTASPLFFFCFFSGNRATAVFRRRNEDHRPSVGAPTRSSLSLISDHHRWLPSASSAVRRLCWAAAAATAAEKRTGRRRNDRNQPKTSVNAVKKNVWTTKKKPIIIDTRGRPENSERRLPSSARFLFYFFYQRCYRIFIVFFLLFSVVFVGWIEWKRIGFRFWGGGFLKISGFYRDFIGFSLVFRNDWGFDRVQSGFYLSCWFPIDWTAF